MVDCSAMIKHLSYYVLYHLRVSHSKNLSWALSKMLKSLEMWGLFIVLNLLLFHIWQFLFFSFMENPTTILNYLWLISSIRHRFQPFNVLGYLSRHNRYFLYHSNRHWTQRQAAVYDMDTEYIVLERHWKHTCTGCVCIYIGAYMCLCIISTISYMLKLNYSDLKLV